MEYLSIYLCHLWFVSLVFYNFLCAVLLSLRQVYSYVYNSFCCSGEWDWFLNFCFWFFIVSIQKCKWFLCIDFVSCKFPEFTDSVWFSCSVVSDSLRPHGLQHARLPCPSPIPRAYSNSCPSSQWCHAAISSSVISFSHLRSFPSSGSFPVSQFFPSGGQSIGVSDSASVLPVNKYSGLVSFRMDWLDLLAVQGTLKSLL